MTLQFRFSEEKAVAALAFVASEKPGLSPFFVSKVMFFADKEHVNRFGRPILGDDYIRMQDGPVPSRVKNYVDEKWDKIQKPANFDRALRVKHGLWLRWLYARQDGANLGLLSDSDKECLRAAIRFCEGKSKDELSELTHLERAWREAPQNRAMDYEKFVDDDNVHKDEIISIMRENAACGML